MFFSDLHINQTVLVGDLGGTNVRFACATLAPDGTISLRNIHKFPVINFKGFDEALTHYLDLIDQRPNQLSICGAGPKSGRSILVTNTGWFLDEAVLEKKFGFERAHLMNDWVGMAYGSISLPEGGLHDIVGGDLDIGQNIALLGPGTGMGVSCLVGNTNGNPHAFACEGGHVGFAPQTPLEREVHSVLARSVLTKNDTAHIDNPMANLGPYISSEMILSGPGLFRLYQTLGKIWDMPLNVDHQSKIIPLAQNDGQSLEHKTIVMFCNILGGFAGNTALIMGARGGVIIGGGVSRHMKSFFEKSNFEAQFKSRGSGSVFVQDLPVKMIDQSGAALSGAAAFVFAQD